MLLQSQAHKLHNRVYLNLQGAGYIVDDERDNAQCGTHQRAHCTPHTFFHDEGKTNDGDDAGTAMLHL